jgi:hypothetical protein
MNGIDHFIVFIFYSDDVTPDINHLYVKRIHLMSFSYIVIKMPVGRLTRLIKQSNRSRSSLHPQV